MKGIKANKIKESILAYLFLLPALVVLSIFTFWPVGFSFVLSFFKWDFRNMRNPYFYGLGNYKEILKFDYPVRFSFRIGLIYSLVYIALAVISVLLIFSLLNVIRKKIFEKGFLFTTIVLVLYFSLRMAINLYFAIVLNIIIYISIILVLKFRLIDTKIVNEHLWIAA
ncbi:MAG: sugar ABC transporter permease, partial [Fervidobacterium sp.]